MTFSHMRYWETLRHLKPSQFIGRLRLLLHTDTKVENSVPPLRSDRAGWQHPAEREPSLLGPARFIFLNQEYDLCEIGWDNPDIPLLWRFNQHYFDDLNAREAGEREAWHGELVKSWIAANPPLRGTPWSPYPTSLRIVNWIKCLMSGRSLPDEVVRSLAMQARWLRKHLEWHLLGNHLLSNAKALVFAGLFFRGREAEMWLATGVRILRKQLPQQVLADGAHFELSPMYHAIALEDVLDLYNLACTFSRDELAQELSSFVPKMLDWMGTMAHPDGQIAFFNDAAMGVAPSINELREYAARLGFKVEYASAPLIHNRESGYVRMQKKAATLFADLARVGPDYLPGHAHADTLSFELSLYGRRLIVNSGTSVYGTCGERLRQRGTAAHSTLVVDGTNSSDVWAGFRVGRRARPFAVNVSENKKALFATGAHNGYEHLRGNPVHRREWRLDDRQLSVTDAVEGAGIHRLEGYFHLGPGLCAVKDANNGAIQIKARDEDWQVHFSAKGGISEVISSSWHPEFGRGEETQAIRVSADRSLPHTLRYDFAWSDQ